MPQQPPYSISPTILSLVAEISEAVAVANMFEVQKSPQLRKQNRIKTITGTLAIEGNTLDLEQVSAIIDNKPVRGTPKEIAEVRGAIKAYDALPQYCAHSLKDLLNAHQKMTAEILSNAGQFRSTNVGIYQNVKLVHVAPQAKRVPSLINDLLLWLQQTDAHPLIRSCVFHYEFEFIHLFSDGNGRIGRLWQTLILGQWHPIFFALPIENTIKNNQQAYYKALSSADDKADSTEFIEFMLSIILTSIRESDPVSDPVAKLLSVMGSDYLSSAQIMARVGLTHTQPLEKTTLFPRYSKAHQNESPRHSQQPKTNIQTTNLND